MKSLWKRSGRCLIAAVLLSAALCSTASAVEGPYYTIGGGREEGGMSEPWEVKATAKSYVFKTVILTLSVTVTCPTMVFSGASELVGSTGGNAGKGHEKFIFSSCTVTGNGATCKLKGNGFETKVLVDFLSYTQAERKGKVGMLIKPETGTEIGVFEFESCTVSGAYSLSGLLVAEVLGNKKTIEIGKEELQPEKEVWELSFPPTQPAETFVETNGQPNKEAVKFEINNKAATMEGLSEIELWVFNKINWGFSTK